MTLRFLDLTVLFRFLTTNVTENTKSHHANNIKSKAWGQKLSMMAERARQRRQLLKLSDAQLDDIGVTRAKYIYTGATRPSGLMMGDVKHTRSWFTYFATCVMLDHCLVQMNKPSVKLGGSSLVLHVVSC